MERLYASFPDLRHPIRVNEKEMHWSPQKPMIMFAFSRIEFLHPDMRRDWQEAAIVQMAKNPHATYVILTKFPWNYPNFDWPANCWLGTTVDGLPHTADNVYHLLKAVPESYLRFVSWEPLLKEPGPFWILPFPPLSSDNAYIPDQYGQLDWAIIGANSNEGAAKPPDRWADILINPCRQMKIPVLVKSNYRYSKRIKEMPGGWVITDDGDLIQTVKPQMELF